VRYRSLIGSADLEYWREVLWYVTRKFCSESAFYFPKSSAPITLRVSLIIQPLIHERSAQRCVIGVGTDSFST